MITVPYFFSDNAIFQSSSVLTLNGKCEPDANVLLEIVDKNNTALFSSVDVANAYGAFSLTVKTPAPSFDEYTVVLECGAEKKSISNVLFGEVWLASGQSNMELQNSQILGHEDLFKEVKDKKIRVYHVEYPAEGGAFAFPEEPDSSTCGFWVGSYDSDALMNVSAIGLKFANELYDELNAKENVPVAFLNASWGGTGITTWLSLEYIDKDAIVSEKFKKYGIYPVHEKWNTAGDLNFQQTCSQYNYKIAPLLGMKFRGVIWYQGENECWGEYDRRFYADCLRLYHRMYSELFAAGDDFMMISSLIYPWVYGDGDCNLGYLNDAFVTTSVESPTKFACMPIGDLEPIWAFHHGNHPIHPTNKYAVGSRLATLALRNVYGTDGQTSPAHLAEYYTENGMMILRFDGVGDGLYIGDKNPKRRAHCLYAAGEDDIYLPAECRIVSPDTLEVWCDGLDEVKNVCYAFQSFDVKCNIFAGDFPVMPFATEKDKRISFDLHLWYDSSCELCWAPKLHDDVLDVFYHPIWNPTEGSEVCHDTAFTRDTTASVRVCSDDVVCNVGNYGCYVKSYPYNKLDLFRYKAIEADFYNADKVKAELILTGEDGDTVIPFERISDVVEGAARYSASLDGLSEQNYKKMTFSFSDEKDRYHFVNIERIRLIRK